MPKVYVDNDKFHTFNSLKQNGISHIQYEESVARKRVFTIAVVTLE